MEGFEQYAARLTYRHTLFLAAAVVGIVAVFWPLDGVIYDDPHMANGFAVFRLGVAGVITIGVPVVVILARRGIDLFPWVALLVTITAAIRGHGIAIAGGLEQPVFHTGYFVPLATVPLIWSLPRRVVATGAIAVAYLVAYFATRSAEMEPPFFGQVVAFVIFAAVVSTLLGHTIYRLLRIDHAHREALEAQSRETAEVNRRLEGLVAERTEQLRGLASHIEASREEERRRLAREIHDETGQLLTAMRMEVGMVRNATGDVGRGQGLERMDGLIDQALDATRALVAELRPRVLDDLGLAAAAEWYLERFAERSGLACAWEVALGGFDLDAPRATAVFRILQESLTNVARHARAKNVEVTLRREDGAITLEVRDDGVGLGEKGARREGFGLLGMRERARDLGGTVDVAAAEPSGTRVRLRLPLAESPS